MPQDDFIVTVGIQNSPATEFGQDLAVPDHTTNVASRFGPPFTEPAMPCYSPCYDAPVEELQPIEFSSNGYSSIGSHFHLDKAQGIEEDPSMDPVFSQYLPTDVRHNLDSTAANQMSSENRFLPFSPNMSADNSVPPAVLTTKDDANIYCNISVTGRAVLRTNTNTLLASTTNYFPTGHTTPSENSPSFASVETTHLDGRSMLSHPCYNASSAAHTSPNNPAALTGHSGNCTQSRLTAVTETFSNPIFAIYHLGQETSSSLASMETLQAKPPQAIDYHGHDDLTDAITIRNLSSISPVSVTGSKLDYSKCPWAGCSTVKKGKNRKSNMRNHVRISHEKPAPPLCELCGKKYKQHESLKRHLLGQEHQFDLPDPVRTVRKISAGGRVYTT